MRMVKSGEEIAWTTARASRIADIGRRGLRGGHRGPATAGVRGGPARDPGHWCGRSAGGQPHVELMDTWTWFQSGINYRRRPQPGHVAQDRARRHPEPELLPDARRLLHGAGAHACSPQECSDEHLRLWKINIEVHCRPGSPSSSPASAAATSPPSSTRSTSATACWRDRFLRLRAQFRRE